jgi:cell division septal protein FtsQ
MVVWVGKVWRRLQRWEEIHRIVHSTVTVIAHGYLLVVMGIGVIALLSNFSANRIQFLSVEGNRVVSSSSVVQAIERVFETPAALIVRRDLPLWAPHEEIAAAIYALDPHIHEVAIAGRFSRTLHVAVTEESPAMLWCEASQGESTTTESQTCWFANDEGKIYANAPAYTEPPFPVYRTTPAPIFHDQYPREHIYPIGYMIADETTMDRLSTLSQALSERGYQVRDFTVTDDADVMLRTKEGTEFLFSLARDILSDMKRFEALRDALSEKGESAPLKKIDLRFDTKVYYQ